MIGSDGASKPALLVVFYANPDFYPPTYNAVCLLAERFRVHLVCRADDAAPSLRWPDEVEVERVGPWRSDQDRGGDSPLAKTRELMAFVGAVRAAVSRDRPALALAYEQHALFALRAAGYRGPHLYQLHELEEPGPLRARSLGAWVIAAARILGRRADLVVFPDRERAHRYQRIARDPRKPLVVPNFPRRSVFAAPDPSMNAARWEQAQVFYRGAIGSANGATEMIDALPRLNPRCSLRLYGRVDPAYLAELEARAAATGVRGRLSYGGFSSYDEVNEATRHAAVGLVLQKAVSLNWEHIAAATNKLYEYAACGLPAVVPDRPGFREFLAGETWVEYADERDPSSIAAAIGRVLEGRERWEERSRAARRAFEERFNYEAVFAPMLARALDLARGPLGG